MIPTLTATYRFREHSPYVSEFSPYANEFIKHFGKYVIDLDDPTAPARRLEPTKDSEIVFEIYHDLLRFHYCSNSPLIKKTVQNPFDAVDKTRESIQALIDSLLEQHHQLDILSIELGYMPV